ncbi:MAG: hypothetical protein QOI36_812 [Pseudonocardiales bacterium]|nr:hypothetical protein [Pseudonocardiales bacterium]
MRGNVCPSTLIRARAPSGVSWLRGFGRRGEKPEPELDRTDEWPTILVAGDAGHPNSPADGQGMNSRTQDAHNLAWRLAPAVTDGDAEAAARIVFRGADLADQSPAITDPADPEHARFSAALGLRHLIEQQTAAPP